MNARLARESHDGSVQQISGLTQSPSAPRDTPSVWQTVREFPRPVWFLFLGMFLNRFGTFVVPFLALHITRLGYSARQAGLALGAFGAGHLLAAVIGGQLADSLGRRRTIMLSVVSGAFCMLLLSQAVAFGWLVTLAFLTGLVGEFYRPASSALLADLVPDEHRVTAYAAFRFSVNAGWAFGPAVAGMLAHRSYSWLFWGDAATSLLFGAVALLWLPRDQNRPPRHLELLRAGLGGLGAMARVARGDWPFLQLTAATFASALVFMQLFTTLGLEMRAAGIPDTVYGLVLALNGVLIVLFEIPLTSFTRRGPPRRFIAAGFALIGIGAGSFAWADSAWGYALGMAVLTAGEMFSMPVALAYVVSLAPADMRGRYLGIYGLTWAAALTVGPSLGTALFSWDPAGLWVACGLTGIAAAWWVALRGRTTTRDSRRVG